VTAAVFLGPSLPQTIARTHLDAVYLPPARRGDVYRAARDLRPTAILIIDGRFHDTAAIWHREILWALTQGVHVFGAASMGALRAAELDRFGMRGLGRVYEAYRVGRYAPFDDPFDDDGEVAVTHAPAELGSTALSVALVDLRETLARSWRDGVISATERDALMRAAGALFHAERTPERVATLIDARISDPAARAHLTAHITAAEYGVKASDARAALDALAAFLTTAPRPFVPGFAFEPALVWERFRRAMDAPAAEPPNAIESAVLEEVRIDPAAWRALRQRAVLRRAACRPIGDDAPIPDAAARRQALAGLRRAHGLEDRAALDSWMARNALTPAAAEALIDSEAALHRLADLPIAEIERAMLELLRLDASFESLAARAARRVPRPAPNSSARAARETALVSAFVERHADAWESPLSTATLIALLDCRDEAHLFAVLEKAFAAVVQTPS